MARPIEELKRELLELAPEERAQLAHELIVSLEESTDSDVEAAWFGEILRRDAEVERGEAKLIPAEDALRQIRIALKR